MTPEPDMNKVHAALERYGRRKKTPAWRQLPPVPVTAQDAALRKPLKSHGQPCRGFNCHHFLNRD